MFAADPRITHIPALREQVVSLSASLNKPHIAVPGRAAQEVQAYVVGIVAGGGFSLFVYLFLTSTFEAVVYVDHDRLRVDAQGYKDVETEAMAFLESMGFMMEPLNFRRLSPEQQDEVMKNVPCFTKDLKALAAAAAPREGAEQVDPPQLRLARLLAAF
ncbi:MAG TPA: hypothetical protein DFS52_01025 [Myxococcales bacterium]|jgi:hypothetical protein|nr:hypothetical protein [Myxococcales bacterium]